MIRPSQKGWISPFAARAIMKGHRHTNAVDKTIVRPLRMLARAVIGRLQIAVLLGVQRGNAAVVAKGHDHRGLKAVGADEGAGMVVVDRLPSHRAAGQERHRPGRAFEQPATQRDAVELRRSLLIDNPQGGEQLRAHLHLAVDEHIIGDRPDRTIDRRVGGKDEVGLARGRDLPRGCRLEILHQRAAEVAAHLDLDGGNVGRRTVREHEFEIAADRVRQGFHGGGIELRRALAGIGDHGVLPAGYLGAERPGRPADPDSGNRDDEAECNPCVSA